MQDKNHGCPQDGKPCWAWSYQALKGKWGKAERENEVEIAVSQPLVTIMQLIYTAERVMGLKPLVQNQVDPQTEPLMGVAYHCGNTQRRRPLCHHQDVSHFPLRAHPMRLTLWKPQHSQQHHPGYWTFTTQVFRRHSTTQLQQGPVSFLRAREGEDAKQ